MPAPAINASHVCKKFRLGEQFDSLRDLLTGCVLCRTLRPTSAPPEFWHWRLLTNPYRRAEARPAGPHPFNRTLRFLLARHGFSDISNRQAPEFLVRPALRHEIRLVEMAHWRINEAMREY